MSDKKTPEKPEQIRVLCKNTQDILNWSYVPARLISYAKLTLSKAEKFICVVESQNGSFMKMAGEDVYPDTEKNRNLIKRIDSNFAVIESLQGINQTLQNQLQTFNQMIECRKKEEPK